MNMSTHPIYTEFKPFKDNKNLKTISCNGHGLRIILKMFKSIWTDFNHDFQSDPARYTQSITQTQNVNKLQMKIKYKDNYNYNNKITLFYRIILQIDIA